MNGYLFSYIYYITTWLTSICNTHIAQYLRKEREADNEIWSVNRISQEKSFPSEIMQKMMQRD